MSEDWPVMWAEAARVAVGCAVVLVITWAALELSDERHVPVAGPLVMALGWWFYNMHRHWGAGLVAAVSSVVVFTVADRRPHVERLLADTMATAAGLLVAVAMFTVCFRVRRRA
ncbi:hypothetical protein [Streptomyces sp. NPDC056821]|uniref:hypothetical protein n=1 Tax=unclassified Streptomyces TaxID=2593676 RepID=UPI0036798496